MKFEKSHWCRDLWYVSKLIVLPFHVTFLLVYIVDQWHCISSLHPFDFARNLFLSCLCPFSVIFNFFWCKPSLWNISTINICYCCLCQFLLIWFFLNSETSLSTHAFANESHYVPLRALPCCRNTTIIKIHGKWSVIIIDINNS